VAVTDEAILQIKGMILSGELRPGDRLPPEKELSEHLGLSRGSLREAVKALEVIRVLDVRRGDGTYVTSLDPGLLLEAISFVIDLHNDDSILELFAVRRILEAPAAALAAERSTPEEVIGLRKLIDAVDRVTDIEGLVAHDLQFHAAVASLSGNGYLATLIESLARGTERARVWRGLTQANATERTLNEHAAIVDAIAVKDAGLAESLSIAHVAGIENWIRAWSTSDGQAPPSTKDIT